MGEKEFLILVDETDKPIGTSEKQLIHEKGLLHRAFSVFTFNPKGEMLLQKRADGKYHSAGLWTNACCSHPRFGEELTDAVKRRLKEEMGLLCKTEFAFSFQYKTELENGLIENEIDHVFIGVTAETPLVNYNEVKTWKYLSVEEIRMEIQNSPKQFTYWFKLAFENVIKHYLENRHEQAN